MGEVKAEHDGIDGAAEIVEIRRQQGAPSARDETLEELRRQVPGLVEGDTWREIWAALLKEQQSLSAVFDA